MNKNQYLAQFLRRILDAKERAAYERLLSKGEPKMPNPPAKKAELVYDNMDILRMGNKIVLPAGMGLEEAIVWLHRKMEEEEQEIAINREFKAFPLDGACALARSIAKKYGWAGMKSTPGFFGNRPPQMIHVKLADGSTIEVPWGRFTIPDIEGWIAASISRSRSNMPQFCLQGIIKQKDRHKALELGDLIALELQHNSIYKGEAMRFVFPDMDDAESFDPTIAPEFLELNRVNPEDLILSEDVMDLVQTTLFAPIIHTQKLREQQIPLKRGILLEGPYGVGKTLLAYVTAYHANKNGWTYIYSQVNDLDKAIEFALMYEPAVVFAEDLDQVLGDMHRRDEVVNSLLNTIDGVQVKGREIMVVLTTNHVERINKAMLRPGRLDTVITIAPPDAPAAIRLVQLYARELLDPTADLEAVGKLLEGQIPAVVREVVERSKLYTIYRGRDELLTSKDLEIAARGMMRHLKLLETRELDTRTPMEKSAEIIARALNGADKEGHA